MVCRIADGETGIRDYRGTIDGRWVLFKYSSKNAASPATSVPKASAPAVTK